MANGKKCSICGDHMMRITEGGIEKYLCYHCGITDETLDFFVKHTTEYMRVDSLINLITTQIRSRADQEFILIDIFVDGEEMTIDQLLRNITVDEVSDVVYLNGNPISGEYDILENVVSITISLRTKKLRKIEKECSSCSGTGVVPYSGHSKCDVCDGRGIIIKFK